jgi:DNA-directed RNA polymerase specialized sigma24 family protein
MSERPITTKARLLSNAAFSPDSGVSGSVNAFQKQWRLTREGFDKFLLALNPDREEAGRRYELLRAKLISFFDWRDCPAPEDHADEALTRVVRKIDAGEELRDPSTYVFGVARMMLLEISRANERHRNTLSRLSVATTVDQESADTQRRIELLRRCLRALPDKDRELITEYYEGEGSTSKIIRRKELALRLGLQLNALRIRACRLREKLERCLQRRLAEKRI